MKFIFSYILSALIFNASIAQRSSVNKVPEQIALELAVKYPSAHIENWSFRNNIYEVAFKRDEKKLTAFYDSAFKWLKTETIIPWARKLPKVVESGFYKSQFGPWYIERILRSENAEGTCYKFLVNNGPTLNADNYNSKFEKYSLAFSLAGVLRSRTLEQRR